MHRQEYAEVRKWEETQWLWISSQWHPGLCLENAAFPSLLSVGRLTEQCHSHKKCPQPLNLFATISQFLDKRVCFGNKCFGNFYASTHLIYLLSPFLPSG